MFERDFGEGHAMKQKSLKKNNLADVSDIFCFFLLGGRGSPRPRGGRGGVDFLLKIPEGVVSRRGRGRGAGRVSAPN